ncbi:DUF4256 domain-containing protein [Arenibacter sp. F26102]|uniref:DUF4256 domain-containing protein n=1 Tax=Arenibacter sp. F26102 TaxID=2926416 RepID=UPI001FF2046F|nr:DUF4256 domain-containing protein [Arenibacter sp. F26102]MCK0146559.1 DUF4256 domain-containing protein [Arenibacter sp. F26102]
MSTMKLTENGNATILEILKVRFNQNIDRHKGFEWNAIENRLKDDPSKLWSLNAMEKSGGEPDVVDFDLEKGEYLFFDCSAESPTGRRSACYDHEAQESRKKFKPDNNACDLAAAMGVNILNEEQYRYLQKLGKFDAKTSSWIQTPYAIRKLGGALFADFRYNHVFIYHNGADSYYAARGFRASLRV